MDSIGRYLKRTREARAMSVEETDVDSGVRGAA